MKILGAVDYGERLINKIVNIIDGHDTTCQARSVEDAITKDAYKLFGYSEFGFCIDVQTFDVKALPHIKYLIERLDEWFLTHEGKKLAIHEGRMREKEMTQKTKSPQNGKVHLVT